MIATSDLCGLLATEVLNTVKNQGVVLLREVKSLGRKLKEGEVQIIGTEVYAGPSAEAAPYAYIRYRDARTEHTFTQVKGYTSAPHVQVRALLRMVVVHKCKNESGLQSAVVTALMISAVKKEGLFSINIVNASGRGQTVLAEETKEPQDFLGEAKLFAVDFDLTYIMSAEENTCDFDCDGCC